MTAGLEPLVNSYMIFPLKNSDRKVFAFDRLSSLVCTYILCTYNTSQPARPPVETVIYYLRSDVIVPSTRICHISGLLTEPMSFAIIAAPASVFT